MNRVVTFNLEEDFIKSTSDFIEENFIKKGLNLNNAAFVFGGKRPALFLKKELSRRLKKGFFPPAIFSMDEFIEYVVSKKEAISKLSDLEACFIIYNIAKKISPEILKARETFSQFLPWAKEILSFIEQMDLEDVSPEALKNIQFNAQIGYDVPKNINALLAGIISIRAEYHKLLLRKKTFSRGLMYLQAKEYADKADFNEFEHIIFCGFFYLHKGEMDLMKKLYDCGKASFLFQGSSEDWTVLAKAAKGLAVSIKPQESPAKRKDCKVSVYSGFDIHSEAALARELLKKIKNPEETVIVLPDAAGVIPLLCEISNFVKDFNISMGYPLNRSSVYSLFECIFRAQETLRKGERGAGAYYTKDYLKVLGHPLIKNLKLSENPSLTRVLIHKIEEALLGSEKTALGGSLFVRLSEIETSSELFDLAISTMKDMNIDTNWDELKGIVSGLHNILFYQWEKINSFNEFSLSLDRLLDELVNKSSLSSYPFNLKMVERLFSIKDELAGASFKTEIFAKEDIFKIFKNNLDSERISFSGSPLKGLQILGLFETRSLNFENVLIMDVNESVLPSLKIYEPLIPREIMISLGINRIEKEEEIQRYQFTRLIRSAKTAHLLYQKRDEKEKSRFLEEIVWEKEKLSGLGSVVVPQAVFSVKVLPKRLEIEKTPDTVKFLKEMNYSASSVNTYLWCPLRFYYQYVLGLKEKEELLDEPEAKDVGTFIHELFETVFSRFIGKRPSIDKTFKDVFFAALDKKFNDEFKRKFKSDSFLIKEVLDVRLARFLENENKRGVAKILCLEKTFKSKLEFASGTFGFKSIVDRIDKLSDGSILILDYKTGDSDIMPDANMEKIRNAGFQRKAIKHTVKSFQLPLYLHMVGCDPKFSCQNINAALYFIKNTNKDLGLARLFRNQEQLENKVNIMQAYMEALGYVLKDILNPDKPFLADDEDPGHCSFCPFFYLCR